MPVAMETFGSGVEGSQDTYAYPKDLARFARESWEDHAPGADGPGHGPTSVPGPILRRLFSTFYQASLLREEERPVSFRAILAAPEDLPEGGGPPAGLHRLAFGEPRPFDERELRRLSPAADFEQALIGVRRGEDGDLEIWGLVHSGALAPGHTRRPGELRAASSGAGGQGRGARTPDGEPGLRVRRGAVDYTAPWYSEGGAFSLRMSLWWSTLMSFFAQRAGGRHRRPRRGDGAGRHAG